MSASWWWRPASRRVLVAGVLGLLLARLASGQDQPAPPAPSIPVLVARPWARATTSDALSAAIYLTLGNPGKQDEELRGAVASGCDHCELHVHHVDAQGVMHMAQVDHLTIPAGGSLVLQPGAIHIMLLGLSHGLAEGSSVRLTLSFIHGAVTVQVPVLAAGAISPDG